MGCGVWELLLYTHKRHTQNERQRTSPTQTFRQLLLTNVRVQLWERNTETLSNQTRYVIFGLPSMHGRVCIGSYIRHSHFWKIISTQKGQKQTASQSYFYASKHRKHPQRAVPDIYCQPSVLRLHWEPFKSSVAAINFNQGDVSRTFTSVCLRAVKFTFRCCSHSLALSLSVCGDGARWNG